MRILQDTDLEMVAGGADIPGIMVQVEILHSPFDKIVQAPGAAETGTLGAFGIVTAKVDLDAGLYDALNVSVLPG